MFAFVLRPGQVSPRLIAAILVAVALLCVLTVPPRAAAQGGQTPDCAIDPPKGWSVIPQGSVNQAQSPLVNVLCNYEVKNGGALLAGVAFTFEFGTESAIADRWKSINPSARTNTIARSSTRVVTQEGVRASVQNSRSDRPITSTFFPEYDFGLQEKSWWMPNTCTLITTVVNSGATKTVNEYGPLFKVAETEDYASTLLRFFSRSTADPDCTGGGGSGAVGSTSGGSKGKPIAGVVIGGVVISGAGVVIWRRKGPGTSRPFPIDPSKVAAPCQAVARAYNGARDAVITLVEAHDDLNKTLEAAEKRQASNVAKARLLVGFEIGTAIGGAVDGLNQHYYQRWRDKYRMGGAATNILGQQDTWKPPRTITGELEPLMSLLKQVDDAIDAMSQRARSLAKQIAEMSSAIANLPSLQESKAQLEKWTKRVGELRDFFTRKSALEKRWADVDDSVEALNKAVHEAYVPLQEMEGALNRSKEMLKRSTEAADKALGPELARCENNIARFTSEMTEIQRDLPKLAARTDAAGKELHDELAGRLKFLQRAVPDAHAEHARFKGQYDQWLGNDIRNVQRMEKEMEPLRKNHDFYKRKVVEQEAIRGQLTAELQPFDRTSTAQVEQQMVAAREQLALWNEAVQGGGAQAAAGKDLEALQSEFARLNTQLEGEVARRNGLRDQVDGPGGGPGQRRPAQPPSRGAQMGWAEWLLHHGLEFLSGGQQGWDEVWEILMAGKAHIDDTRIRLNAVDRVLDQERKRAKELRDHLDACTKANPVPTTTEGGDGAAESEADAERELAGAPR